jgi:hypothetical protein
VALVVAALSVDQHLAELVLLVKVLTAVAAMAAVPAVVEVLVVLALKIQLDLAKNHLLLA